MNGASRKCDGFASLCMGNAKLQCVLAGVRACVRAWVRACVHVWLSPDFAVVIFSVYVILYRPA